jgi:hypothetical protein
VGYGPWLVAMAALLLALVALAVALARGAAETRYVDRSRVNATVLAGTDCIDGMAVARDGVRADGAGRLGVYKTAVGGTLDELSGRVDLIETAGVARARCRVELLASTPGCASSLTAPRVVTVAAGPTRQGYGETGAGAILGAPGTSTSTGGPHGELRLVDDVTLRPRFTIANQDDLLWQACRPGGASTRSVGFTDAGTPAGDRASAAPASAPVRDLALIGGLVLVLAGIAATMSRRRVR